MSKEKFQYRQNFLITFGYNGYDFFGVQFQPRLATVCGAIKDRVFTAIGQKAHGLSVAARTDRGVHAKKNLATFYLNKPFLEEKFLHSFLSVEDNLKDIKIYQVDPNFHARGSSLGKIYLYKIFDDQDLTMQGEDTWTIFPKLDIDAMKKAAEFMVGNRDFSSLRGGGCGASSAIKEINYIKILQDLNKVIHIEISGNSFLRKMIRNMVGLLVEVGVALRKPEEIEEILAKKDRQAAGITVPPHGLTLLKVMI